MICISRKKSRYVDIADIRFSFASHTHCVPSLINRFSTIFIESFFERSFDDPRNLKSLSLSFFPFRAYNSRIYNLNLQDILVDTYIFIRRDESFFEIDLIDILPRPKIYDISNLFFSFLFLLLEYLFWSISKLVYICSCTCICMCACMKYGRN